MNLLLELHRVERPRERLESLGPEALSDRELVALLLGTGYGGANVMEVADAVLRAAPEGAADLETLRGVKGVGGSRAAALVAAFELGRRRASAGDSRPSLNSPEKVAQQVPAEVKKAGRENFIGFYLNARSQLLHMETISIGTLSASLVHPREVFLPAIAQSAAAVVVAHNHPSGDCRPSAEDKDATRRLARAGELLGIPLLDHVVVSARAWYSLKENGDF